MMSLFSTERGYTLILVMGLLLVISLVAIPLITSVNTGMLQAQTAVTYEQASESSESAVRVVRKLLQQTVNPSNTNEQNRELVENLIEQIEEKGLFPNTEFIVVIGADGLPARIEVKSHSGSSLIKRDKTTPLLILRFPSRTGGGTGDGPGGSGHEFYYQAGAVANYPVNYNKDFYNAIFSYCDAPPEHQAEVLVVNDYDSPETNFSHADFVQQFADYIDYYLNDAKSKRPLPLDALPIPATVAAIGQTLTPTSTTYNFNTNGTVSGVLHGGNVTIGASTLTVNTLSGNTSLEASGNLILNASLGGNTTFKGNVKVGGNVDLHVSTASQIRTIEGDLLVKGNFIMNPSNWGTNNELVINGDMIVAGNVTFNNIKKITIKGNLIIGGKLIVNQTTTANFVVEGTLSANAMDFRGTNGMLTVGKWSGNTIVGDSSSSLIAQTSMEFNITDAQTSILKVAGDISARSFPSSFRVNEVHAGGSFIAGGNISIYRIEPWYIGKSFSVSGNMSITNEIYTFEVAENVIIKGTLNFNNSTVRDMYVKGSLVASNDILFYNGAYKIRVDGDMMAGNNMRFEEIGTHVPNSGILHVGGLFAALNNVQFTNHTYGSHNQFGGFYVGGVVSFDYSTTIGTFCIRHDPPDPANGAEIGLEFGN